MKVSDFIDFAARKNLEQCLLWPISKDKGGYCRFSKRNGNVLAHRVICTRAHGDAPQGQPYALHACGNPSCVNPRHLRWGTQSENRWDMAAHGTMPIGEANGAARLREEQVVAILAASQAGVTQRAIAAKFGVGVATVCNIVNKKAWSHIHG